jgi:Mg2+ and Co2+ transporter CorA
VLERFCNSVRTDSSLSAQLFFLDVLVADETMINWQKEIKSQRDNLKLLESTDYTEADKDTIAKDLHSLSQSWHIHSRNLLDFETFAKFIQSASKRFSKLSHQLQSKKPMKIKMKRGPGLEESVRYLLSSCQSLRHLIADYRGRTDIQIQLLFHLANQEESRANKAIAAQNKKIAELTAKLAQRTQRDSSSMITIAAVTMFFLPGTFVASIFSTIFFSFDEKGIKVSSRWWIFPTAVVPSTVLVFVIWLGWLRWRRVHESVITSRDIDEKDTEISVLGK